PISTFVLRMTNNSMGAGMGTSGLVGPIGAYTVMSQTTPVWLTVTLIIVMCFVLPSVLSLCISEFMRKKGWIKFGDMQLEDLK
ncbi:MAG: PTS sugar transporter subunit IIC, partial [Eubacteriales bacterium]|nr:PTS sugar transporter subunit IIC [Eubacteriales bacterium]